MSDIKFKFWDKSSNVWRSPDEHKFGILITCDGFEFSTGWDSLDKPRFGTNDEEGYRRMSDEEFEKRQDNFIPCQFTRIKDKNGKDIYEGDIVHFFRFLADKDGYIGVVYFDKGQYLLKPSITIIECRLYDHLQNIVVLGNIFENPELITV